MNKIDLSSNSTATGDLPTISEVKTAFLKKAAFIAICGSPNVGKSTILNQIIGTKLSIVSPKVQTTRTTLKGIHNQDNCQLVFVDTPGIFAPKRALEEAIVKTAWSGIEGIDLVLLVVDAIRGVCLDTTHIIEKLTQHKVKPILLINKQDLVTKEKLNRMRNIKIQVFLKMLSLFQRSKTKRWMNYSPI